MPFVDWDGDHMILDLDPGPAGQPGQVITYGHETGAGMRIAPDFAAWLEMWADDLEQGRLLIGDEHDDIDEEEADSRDTVRCLG